MFSAVHSDRSGRVYVSADWAAGAFDGERTGAPRTVIALPEGSTLVPLAREAEGLDRLGRVRGLGASRWALGALLPPGYVRTHHPAYRDLDLREPALTPLPTAAVCADDSGTLYVSAIPVRPVPSTPSRSATIAPATRPGNRLARQLARCAREHACAGAAAALAGRGVAALPVSARANESPPPIVAPRARADATPRDVAAFRPSAAEIAEVALAHLAGGGEAISFGRACEGEPLTAVRLLEDAIGRIRQERPTARIHLETNGCSPSALRRLIEAGLSEVTVRLASARGETYDLIHAPIGYRYTDVRSALAVARSTRAQLTLAIMLLPGLTDRPRELEALAQLTGDTGASLELRDLGADAGRLLGLLPRGEAPLGIEGALERLLGVTA